MNVDFVFDATTQTETHHPMKYGGCVTVRYWDQFFTLEEWGALVTRENKRCRFCVASCSDVNHKEYVTVISLVFSS